MKRKIGCFGEQFNNIMELREKKQEFRVAMGCSSITFSVSI